MTTPKTIDPIVQMDLCNGCGTCYSICPAEAISIETDKKRGHYIAKVDKVRCIECGQCRQVCHSNLMIFDKKFTLPDPIGDYDKIYTGYIKDGPLRNRASSGGIISGILKYLMINGFITGFMIIVPRETSPFEYDVKISEDVEDIAKYSGTRYIPISINKILKELSIREGKFAIIGTPCQMASLRAAEELNPSIKEKIFVRIGLFCGGTPNLHAYNYYMKMHGIDECNIKSIYRGKGWPGQNVFEQKNGPDICITRRPDSFMDRIHHTIAFYPLFAQKRCLICYDHFGATADISVGDAWLDRFKNDREGVSMIVVRNKEIMSILSQMQQEELVLLNECAKEDVLISQKIFLDYFYNYSSTCNAILAKASYNKDLDHQEDRPDLHWQLKIRLIFIGMKLSQIKPLWRLLFIYGIFFTVSKDLLEKHRKEKRRAHISVDNP